MGYIYFLMNIFKRLGFSLLGFAIIGVGVIIYMASIKNGNFNNPNFLMIILFVIGIIGGLTIIYSLRKS